MIRRWWLALLVGGIGFGVTAPQMSAQEELTIRVETKLSVKDMRDGRKPLKDPNADKAAQNLKDIQETTNYLVMRLTDDVNRGLKSGKTPVPASKIVQDASELVLESPLPPKKFDEKQIAYVEAFGKAIMPPLRKVILGEKDKPSKYEPLVRVNATRILSAVAKSGYPEVAALAVDILSNPKENDSVNFYALQALKHVFAAASPENTDKSTITNADLEKRAIKTLIDFVHRPLPIPKDSPESEIEAFHYVRREAIRALGNVRHPAIRSGKTIEMSPALVLLRFSVGAPAIQPAPNLYERVEALIGYLQLNPDRDEQMDFAGFYVGTAIRLIMADFNGRKDPLVIPKEPGAKIESFPMPKHPDYHPWRLTATRLIDVLKAWKTNWEVNAPQPAPEVKKIMDEVTSQATENLLAPLTAGTLPKSPISLSDFDAFLQRERANVKSQSLFRDDPKSLVWIAAFEAPPEKKDDGKTPAPSTPAPPPKGK